LAAANPQGGRYDPTKSLRANVAMTPAIMSRFDLFFVILDEGDETADFNIARHIVKLHQDISTLSPEYSTEQIQRYIKFARTLKPKIPPESAKLLVEMYLRLRQNDGSGIGKSSYRITVRQLESLVRLSEALARLHCDDEVREKYVKEAYNLLQKSIIHVQSEDIQLEEDARFAAQDIQRPGEDEPNKRVSHKLLACCFNDVDPFFFFIYFSFSSAGWMTRAKRRSQTTPRRRECRLPLKSTSKSPT